MTIHMGSFDLFVKADFRLEIKYMLCAAYCGEKLIPPNPQRGFSLFVHRHKGAVRLMRLLKRPPEVRAVAKIMSQLPLNVCSWLARLTLRSNLSRNADVHVGKAQ